MSFLREIQRIVFYYSRRIYYSVILCFKDIARLAQDYFYDKKLGIYTCYDDSDLEERALFQDEIIYRPTSFHRIRKMIDYLKLGPEDVFVDLGCGKGRVLAMVCQLPIKKAIGVELQKRLARKAEINFQKLRIKKTQVFVVNEDVTNFNPDEGTVFFLYDPFMYQTFTKVLRNIQESLIRYPRKIRIVYFDERYADILNAESWLKLEGEIGHTRIYVWTNR